MLIRVRKTCFGVQIIVLILVVTLYSCNQDVKETHVNNDKKINNETIETKPAIVKFITPQNNENYRTGDKIPVSVSCTDNKIKFDSVVFTFNGKRIESVDKSPFGIKWNTKDVPTGNQQLTATAYFENTKKESSEITVLFRSDVKPKEYTYRILNTYPHDPEAYTQGLVVDKNVMYEGTGVIGASSLRKLNLKTGEVLKSVSIDNNYFGEGITILGNKIYQVTWQTNIGFIYDKETFRQITTFNYSWEGWGLTTDGKQLIMSDGTEKLYFINPESLTLMSTLNVFDYDKEIMYLNELEYIKGEIWANVYQENFIIRIDPKTGKVTGKIDLTGILDINKVTNKIDVLNGIAYDAIANKIYVTGKLWPKLFEIEVTEKKK